MAQLHEACTLDWECKYTSKKTPIHYDSNGGMFIVIDESKIVLSPGTKNLLKNFDNYHVFIPNVPIEKTKTLTFTCFTYQNDLMCDTVNDGFLIFERGTKCTVLGD